VLGRQIYTLYDDLPTPAEVSGYVDRLNVSLDTLPPRAANVADQLLTEAAERIRNNFDVANTQTTDLVFDSFLTLLNAVGFILGFLIIPAWLLMVLQDQRKGAQAVQRVLPAAVRPDVLAVWRILDRAFRTFLEGQVLLALFTAVCLYVGLVFFETIGLPLAQTKLAAAFFMGVLQLVPVIGPAVIIGIVLLNGLLTGFTTKVFVFLGLYLFVLFLVKQTAEPRIERKLVKIHPALLVMVVVALSEFGILWILVAAPITAVFRDLFVYLYGRLSNPPRPAGLLPDEPAPANAAADQPISDHIPLAYRHGRAARRPS
jgi:predicted PurR-regulated permease PerM